MRRFWLRGMGKAVVIGGNLYVNGAKQEFYANRVTKLRLNRAARSTGSELNTIR